LQSLYLKSKETARSLHKYKMSIMI